ncbi:general stress protein [Polyangium sorediatum]|nr:general stress protein [Polyangium sorediatum]MDI1430332.1 general stress protein [Polyangium sorediatum]
MIEKDQHETARNSGEAEDMQQAETSQVRAAQAAEQAEEHEEGPVSSSDLGPATDRKPASQRGFAAMERDKQRAIASKGGKAAHEKGTAHEFTPDEARQAGKKGGEVVSQNRKHMAEIGRKGGERVSQDREHMAQIGRKGGEAVSSDRAHMAQIGRKGGEARGTH